MSVLRKRAAARRIPREAVENAKVPRTVHLEYCPARAGAAIAGGAEQIAGFVQHQALPWRAAIRVADEVVQHSLVPGSVNLKDGAIVLGVSTVGGPIDVACLVSDHRRHGILSVR